jgi:hypothetical protein
MWLSLQVPEFIHKHTQTNTYSWYEKCLNFRGDYIEK